MTRPAVGINDDAIRPIECFRVFGPTVAVDHRGDTLHFIEARLQQKATSTMFVFAGPVAGWAGNEDDFLIGGLRADEAC
jgi:hypothetical protein